MTPGDALRILGAGWAELRDALAAAEAAGIRLRHGEGEAWSPVDLAGHLEAWERLAVELVEDRRTGASPLRFDAVLTGPGAVDAHNARVIEANRSREVADVLARAERTRDELAAAIGGLSAEEWAAPVPSAVRKAVPLGEALGLLLGAPRRPFGHAGAHRSDLAHMKHVGLLG
ncbi:MAG: DinB family protein [Actinomycetota bacterium]